MYTFRFSSGAEILVELARFGAVSSDVVAAVARWDLDRKSTQVLLHLSTACASWNPGGGYKSGDLSFDEFCRVVTDQVFILDGVQYPAGQCFECWSDMRWAFDTWNGVELPTEAQMSLPRYIQEFVYSFTQEGGDGLGLVSFLDKLAWICLASRVVAGDGCVAGAVWPLRFFDMQQDTDVEFLTNPTAVSWHSQADVSIADLRVRLDGCVSAPAPVAVGNCVWVEIRSSFPVASYTHAVRDLFYAALASTTDPVYSAYCADTGRWVFFTRVSRVSFEKALDEFVPLAPGQVPVDAVSTVLRLCPTPLRGGSRAKFDSTLDAVLASFV